MTNVKPANNKLKDRSLRILMAETDLSESEAKQLLDRADADLRIALVMNATGESITRAETLLSETDFVVQKAIRKAKEIG